MDLGIVGECIRGPKETTYFGFWMPSGGDQATGGIDVILLSAANAFDVSLQTKNSEDPDPGAGSSLIGTETIGSTGVTKFDASGAKELVRYVIVGNTDEVDEYMHFQFLAPQWVPN